MLMTPGFEETPSSSEIRVAQAELVGWLEGLLSGIAATAVSLHGTAGEQAAALAGIGGIEIDERPMPGQYL